MSHKTSHNLHIYQHLVKRFIINKQWVSYPCLIQVSGFNFYVSVGTTHVVVFQLFKKILDIFSLNKDNCIRTFNIHLYMYFGLKNCSISFEQRESDSHLTEKKYSN